MSGQPSMPLLGARSLAMLALGVVTGLTVMGVIRQWQAEAQRAAVMPPEAHLVLLPPPAISAAALMPEPVGVEVAKPVLEQPVQPVVAVAPPVIVAAAPIAMHTPLSLGGIAGAKGLHLPGLCLLCDKAMFEAMRQAGAALGDGTGQHGVREATSSPLPRRRGVAPKGAPER